MDDLSFAPVNVVIRVRENELLTENDYNRLIEAPDLASMVRVLKDTKYAEYIEKVNEVAEIEDAFLNHLVAEYSEFQGTVPDPRILELYGLRYAYHNIKVLAKERVLDEDFSDLYIPIGRYPISELRRTVHLGQSDILPEPYVTSIQQMREDIGEFSNAYAIDIILDQRYLEHLHILSEAIGNDYIERVVEYQIDLANISMLLRVKKQGRTTNFLSTLLSEGGDIEPETLLDWNEESLERITSLLLDTRYENIIEESIERASGVIDPIAFNHLAEDALMDVMREGMYTSEGPEPILAYFYALETEIQNLRLVFSGEINNLEPSDIRGRLRELYVT